MNGGMMPTVETINGFSDETLRVLGELIAVQDVMFALVDMGLAEGELAVEVRVSPEFRKVLVARGIPIKAPDDPKRTVYLVKILSQPGFAKGAMTER